jgi:hypothetical protein
MLQAASRTLIATDVNTLGRSDYGKLCLLASAEFGIGVPDVAKPANEVLIIRRRYIVLEPLVDRPAPSSKSGLDGKY